MWYYWDRVKSRSVGLKIWVLKLTCSKLRTVSAIGMEIKFGFARNSLSHSLHPQLGILISWKSPNQHSSESFGSWNSVFITVAEHRSSDKSRKERPTSWTIEIVRDDGFHRFQLGTHYMWCCLRYYIQSTNAVYMKSRTIKIRSQQKVLLLWVVAILFTCQQNSRLDLFRFLFQAIFEPISLELGIINQFCALDRKVYHFIVWIVFSPCTKTYILSLRSFIIELL